MTFSLKIGLAFTGVILLTVFIATANWWGMTVALHRQDEVLRFHNILKQQVQHMVRKELSFSINKVPVHSQNVFSIIESIHKNIENELSNTRNNQNNKWLKSILLDIEDYEKSFLIYSNNNLQKLTLESRLIRESSKLLSVSQSLFKEKNIDPEPIISNIALIIHLQLRSSVSGKSFKTDAADIYQKLHIIKNICTDLKLQSSDKSLDLYVYRMIKVADLYKQIYQNYVLKEQQLLLNSDDLHNQLSKLEKGIDKYLQFESFRLHKTSNTYQKIALLITILAVLLSIFATLFLTELIVKPINKLKESAGQVVNGNLNTFVTITSSDEIGQLGHIFNQMTAKLRDSFQKLELYKKHLETLVEQRTEELELKIIQHENAENALIASQRNIQRIIDQTPVGIILWDSLFHVVQWNPAAEKIFGYTKEESLGKHANFIISPENVDHVSDVLNTLTITKNEIRSNNNNLSKDGNTILCDWYNTPFFDSSGEITGILSIVEDVTDKKRAEMEHFKTAKLESVGVLAGGIAHDFNNILTAILGNINLALLDNGLGDQTKSLLTSAEKASIRAKSLTQQLLTFAKGGEPVKETTSMYDLITESTNFVLHGSNVSAKFMIDENLLPVVADKGQISQVIQNIILNSRHAMSNGGVVTISCTNVLTDDINASLLRNDTKFIHISISDKGTGISAEMLDKIFDPYFTTKQKGSGLGLAITHSIIQKHNGSITVESEIGKGTTFNIFLPTSALPKAPDLTLKQNFLPSINLRILIMDDEEAVINVLDEMLTKVGHSVISCFNGEECLRLYKSSKALKKHIDLLILDLTIPGGKGGKQTAKEILRFDKNAKIIVSSGYSNDPILSNFKQLGCRGALSKPFTSNELYHAVAAAIDNNQ